MISQEDCVALCGLGEREVAAIAAYKHLPQVAAAALANCLLNQEGGPKEIKDMIVCEIRKAFDERREEHAVDLLMSLRQFLDHHPEGSEDSGLR